jgi:hypothetical protein
VSLLLHAITAPPETSSSDLGVQGLRHDPLTRTDVAGLACWSTTLEAPADGTSFTRQDLLDHHRVVTEVFARVEACLPARFPTVLDSARLEALVAERDGSLRRQLEAVRGACELAITAAWTAPEATPPIPSVGTPGTRYLRQRQNELTASAQRRARAEELGALLRDRVANRAREVQIAICPSREVALSAALLVSRVDAEEVLRQVPRAARDVRILLNGPWPPYTFASVRSE